jgi:hypothetical protein
MGESSPFLMGGAAGLVIGDCAGLKGVKMSERRNDERREERSSVGRRGGDRRDSHRVDLPIEVKAGNDDFVTHGGNVAIGGVYFSRPLELPIGAVVQLRFDLPSLDKQVQARAEVVEITAVGKPTDVGTRVRFFDLDLRSELLIARFLDRNPED